MRQPPKTGDWDATLPLLRSDGYRYISRRCEELGSDLFATSFLGRSAVCIRGEDAARFFYANPGLIRKGAAPGRVLKTLLGKGGIHGLDGQEHRDRKQLFMSLMTPDALERVSRISDEAWNRRIQDWERRGRVTLLDEFRSLLCEIICQWAEVPLPATQVDQRAQDLFSMVDAFGAVGPRWWKGRVARLRTEHWIRGVIRQVRAGKLKPSKASAAWAIANHRDSQGQRLDIQTAAVELINVLRPTVAVTYPMIFAALAIHEHRAPERDEELQSFVQEVRRFYPFAPFMGAIATEDLAFHRFLIKKGQLVILDLYGTNRDPRLWKDPDRFIPERFLGRAPGAFDFIPNGGGDFYEGHRCAGEWMTIELLKTAVRHLVNGVEYFVPAQDLDVPMTRLPTLPKSGFVISEISALHAKPSDIRQPASEPLQRLASGSRRRR